MCEMNFWINLDARIGFFLKSDDDGHAMHSLLSINIEKQNKQFRIYISFVTQLLVKEINPQSRWKSVAPQQDLGRLSNISCHSLLPVFATIFWHTSWSVFVSLSSLATIYPSYHGISSISGYIGNWIRKFPLSQTILDWESVFVSSLRSLLTS